jgi:diguanylate cyclase (GGDEF)-like protein
MPSCGRRRLVDAPEERLTIHRRHSPVDERGSASQRRDSAAAERDRAAKERDRAAKERDRAAAERTISEHEQAASDRGESSRDRERSAQDRKHAEERDSAAAERDSAAAERTIGGHEQAARARDQGSRDRERSARDRERAAERDRAAESRDSAAEKRAGAAAKRTTRHRKLTALTREGAARDRDEAAHDRAQAGIDVLTGALRRGRGLVDLQREIDRTRRSDGRLVLAFVDIDGLKAINDTDGHAAGDQLLRDVALALTTKFRSYDLVVRYGGDEFLCTLSGSDLNAARQRFDEVARTLTQRIPAASIGVGLAALADQDTLDELIARADDALYTGRRKARGQAESEEAVRSLAGVPIPP